MKKMNAVHFTSGKRRRQILQAALSCFTELGFTETSMAHICERSGASIGSMYHHFKSKEQLAAAVYMDGILQYQDGLLSALEQEEKAEGGIRAVIEFHLRWVAGNPDRSRFLFQKRHEAFMGGTDDEFNRLNKKFVLAISQWFARHVEAGVIRKMGWDMYLAILLGPCQEFSRLFLSGKNMSSIDRAVEELSRAAWNSLAAKKEQRPVKS
jgi:AcrR family transcriptional regulator